MTAEKNIHYMGVADLVARAHELNQQKAWIGSEITDRRDIDGILIEKYGVNPTSAKETGEIVYLMYGDAHSFNHDPIMKAFKELRLNPMLNKSRPLVVDIYSPDLLLLHRVVLNGHPTMAVNDLLPRKAATVAFTGRRIPDAIDAAEVMGVTLLGGWVPIGRGTDFYGAAPFKRNGEVQLIVAVSGQDHKTVDQPFADAIVGEFDKIEVISIP